MKKNSTNSSKLKRWFIHLLGGAVTVLTISTASVKAQCYYSAQMIPCGAAGYWTNFTASCRGWNGILGIQGVGIYGTSYGSIGSCVYNAQGGNAMYEEPFTGTCAYNYNYNICGTTFMGTKTSPFNINNCRGSCIRP